MSPTVVEAMALAAEAAEAAELISNTALTLTLAAVAVIVASCASVNWASRAARKPAESKDVTSPATWKKAVTSGR